MSQKAKPARKISEDEYDEDLDEYDYDDIGGASGRSQFGGRYATCLHRLFKQYRGPLHCGKYPIIWFLIQTYHTYLYEFFFSIFLLQMVEGRRPLIETRRRIVGSKTMETYC